MVNTDPKRPELIEGVGDEIVIGIITTLSVIFPLVAYILYRSSQQPGIHPDLAHNVESTRQQLNHQNAGVNASTQSQPTQGRQLNSGQLICPICLGEACFAVETNCGHLYCGRCIITYWRHQHWLGAVPCPSCRTQVTLLLLNFTRLENADNTDASRQVRQDVNAYNRRFSGEPRPILDYLHDLPTLLRHAWGEFFSVGGLVFMFRVRIMVIIVLATLYFISPLDIIPEAVFGVLGYFDDLLILLLLAIYISIIYRRVVASRTTGAANGAAM